MDQIHSSVREIDALENKINRSDDSTSDDYAAMRSEQEKQRQQILSRKLRSIRTNGRDDDLLACLHNGESTQKSRTSYPSTW